MVDETVKPLCGLRIVDLGVGQCAALACKLLVDAGATVQRLEPPEGDPFYDIYPAYRFWQFGKTIGQGSDVALSEALIAADLCLIGGEDYPGLNWRYDPATLREGRRRLIVLDITAAPSAWDGEAFPAVELFAQARSGLVFEHYSDRPIMFAFAAASYGAAMHGVAAALAVLLSRGATGAGDVISTSLLQGALRWCAGGWLDAERPGPEFAALIPKDVVPLRFQCADGVHVHITPGVPGTYAKLYDVLGIDDPTLDRNERGSPTGGVHPSRYFGDMELMQRYAGKRQSGELLEALWAQQLPAEPVLLPGGCWDDPQTVHNAVIARDEQGWQYVGNPITYGATTVIEADRPKSDAAPSTAPLSGVRVVDLGSFAAGPHASVILGDLGADVIKIERLEGDPMRQGIHHFAASSRGKRSIAVDAKSAEGAEVIRRICATADVVHHNFRPGVSKRLGIDAEALKQVNLAIIVLESLAYGPSGPKSLQSGFDSCFQAVCGLESFPGGSHNAPINYRYAIADYGTGTVGAIAMLLALLERQNGRACNELYASLLNSGIFLKSEVVRSPDGGFVGAPQYDGEHRGFHPAESLYRTADGWIAIAARDQAMAQRLALSLELSGLADLPRQQWDAEQGRELVAAIGQRSSEQILRTLREADVWAVACERDIDVPLNNASLCALGLVVESDDPALGHVRQLGRGFSCAEAQLSSEGRGLLDSIGGHTREILAQCGYREEEIADLLERKIVA